MADEANSRSERLRRRRPLRLALLIGGPVLVLAIAGYFYITGGRWISTDDAYVKADKVMVSAQVSGPIVAVAVAENQHVAPGDLLFRIEPEPFQVALDRAEAALANVRTDIEAEKASYRQKQEELKLAETNLAFAERELRRQSELADRRVVAEMTLDAARHNADVARQQIAVLRQQRAGILAGLGGDPNIPVAQHPSYQAAKAERDRAALDLDHATVRAPFAGIASKKPEIGQFVTTGSPVMGIVADQDAWVEANLKETDLTHVQPGQAVMVTVDSYPGREWSGAVTSISQATGAEFSVLPAQNATGNWVKVVQRVPVRIALDTRPGDPPLRAGMSVTVEIDTGHQRPLPAPVHTVLSWFDAAPGVAAAQAEAHR